MEISGVWDFQIHFWNFGNSQFQNEASGKTKMDAIAIFHLWIYATFKPKTAYFGGGNTTSYEYYKWIKAVTKLGYTHIHDIMWRNATICP